MGKTSTTVEAVMAMGEMKTMMKFAFACGTIIAVLASTTVVLAQPQGADPVGDVGRDVSQIGALSVERLLSGAGKVEGDSTLQRTLQRAMDANPKFLSKKSAHAAARDAYLKSFAGFLPQLDLTASGGYKVQRNDTTIARYASQESGKWTNEQRLTLSQLIYDGGVVSSKAKADKYFEKAKGEEIYSTAEDVGLSATQYYFEVVRNRGVVSLCEANIIEHERIAELTRVRESSGGGTLADVRQAEAALADARSRLVQAQQNLADAEAGYARFFGFKPDMLVMPDKPFQVVPQSLDMAITQALEKNRALKASEFGVQQKDRELAIAKGQFMPEIRAKASTGRSDNTSGITRDYYDTSGMIFVSLNLFNGGADVASLSKAKNAKLQAKQETDDLRRSVEHDAKVAYNFFKATASLLPILQENVDTNAQVVSGYMDQFRMGKRTLLDLVSAQNSLFSAQQVYLNGITAHTFSYYRLSATSSSLMSTLNINLNVKPLSTD